jgi:hypothetical protein
MLTYVLAVRPQEVVRLLRSEIAAAQGRPELYYSAWEDYVVEEDFDRASYGIDDGAEYNLVSVDAVLNIEPRQEQNYWVLRVVVHRELGPQKIENAAAMMGVTLTLDEFLARLTAYENAAAVYLDVTTPFGKRHFDTWLAELRALRPGGGKPG